jgi:hypothetical protein
MTGEIRFIPVKHGGRFDTGGNLGIWGVSGDHRIIGFKPAPGRKREGWLVVLINDKHKSSAPHRML